jgi:hypothetical protein
MNSEQLLTRHCAQLILAGTDRGCLLVGDDDRRVDAGNVVSIAERRTRLATRQLYRSMGF